METIAGVRKTLKKYNMLREDDKVLVGLSGGADSVCLITVLNKLKDEFGISKLAAAHINHHMRDTADRDMNFCRDLCRSLGIEIFISDINIFELAKINKTSAEDAGRIARYDFFSDLSEKYGFNKTATAHNMNDQAETFLMRILSGTTLDGLSCIKPIRQDGIIRPLIETKRCEIEDFLKSINQPYMTDETNADSTYKRNSIRLELIPFIEKKYNPSFIDTSSGMVEALTEDSAYINKMAMKLNRTDINDICYLNELDDAILSRIIPEIIGRRISKKGTEEIIRLIRKNRSGSSYRINNEKSLYIEFGKLVIRRNDPSEDYCIKLNAGRNYIEQIDALFTVSEGRACGNDSINVESIDNLYVRTRREGDRIYNKKLGGRKKIKDIFIEKRIPSGSRNKWPIITENEEIIWVTGLYKNEKTNTKYNIKAEWRGF